MKLSIVGFLAITLLGAGSVFAGDLTIIANSSVQASEISADDLQRIYLEQTTSLKGSGSVEPVLIKGGPTQAQFAGSYLNKTGPALLAYYRSLMFTGKGRVPKMFDSEDELVAYVAKTKGAIGYVSSAAAAHDVKTLTLKVDGQNGNEHNIFP